MKNFICILILTVLVSCTGQNQKSYDEYIYKIQSTSGYNNEYLIVIDYTIPSGLKRGFLIKVKTKEVLKSFLVAHGGGFGESRGVPKGFSNVEGSNASSLGWSYLSYRGASMWGIGVKYCIEGLEEVNSNMRGRNIVLHSWEGIPNKEVYPETIVQSQGCPTVSNQVMYYLDNFIKNLKNKKILIKIIG